MQLRLEERAPIAAQLPTGLQQLLEFERYHLHHLDVYQGRGADPGFDVSYLPQNGNAFRLPCYWVSPRHLLLYCSGADAHSDSSWSRCNDDKILCAIHPTSMAHYEAFLSQSEAEEVDEYQYWAIPTSSTRTVLAWRETAPEGAVFVKTSLSSPVLGNRFLTLAGVCHSIGLTQLLETSRPQLPASFKFFPEQMGIVPRSLRNSGTIIRSIPSELKNGELVLAPMFSLFGGTEQREPLMLRLLRRTGLSPLRFAEEVLCIPFLTMWMRLSMQLGLLPEAHAQNLLLVLTPDLLPTGSFCYRDMEGMQVDWELRAAFGLPSPERMPFSESWHETYATWGCPLGQLASFKLVTSLFNFLNPLLDHFVPCVQEWQEQRLLPRETLSKEDLSAMFCEHVARIVHETFGIAVPVREDMVASPHKFAGYLLTVRSELLGGRVGRFARRVRRAGTFFSSVDMDPLIPNGG